MDEPAHNEWWIDLTEHPGYAVSEFGKVINKNNNRLKQPSCNAQGILMVNLSRNSHQQVRSVAVLVADHFLDHREFPEHFDTPIHLNGDRTDCRAVNLQLRPRWFAIMYHKQFRLPNYGVPSFVQPIKNRETGEVFVNSWDAALQYGMLETKLVVDTMNRDPTGFQNYHFEFI